MTRKNSANSTFSVGPGHGNVNLSSGWRRPTEEFDLYGEAFRRAGQTLAQNLANDITFHPLDACPIVFLYRHAIELYFKAILRVGQNLLSLEGNSLSFDEKILVEHKLTPFLVPIRKFYDEFGWPEAYEDCAVFVTDLEAIDPLSFAFRYPVDKQDGSLLQDLVFNVPEFAARAERVLEVLYELLHGIEHRFEQATQWLSDNG